MVSNESRDLDLGDDQSFSDKKCGNNYDDETELSGSGTKMYLDKFDDDTEISDEEMKSDPIIIDENNDLATEIETSDTEITSDIEIDDQKDNDEEFFDPNVDHHIFSDEECLILKKTHGNYHRTMKITLFDAVCFNCGQLLFGTNQQGYKNTIPLNDRKLDIFVNKYYEKLELPYKKVEGGSKNYACNKCKNYKKAKAPLVYLTINPETQ